MQIGESQFARLEQSRERAFEDELSEHVRHFAPGLSRSLPAASLNAAIRRAVARAQSHGFRTRATIRFYVELAFMFGSDFDTDPMLPWAGAVLKSDRWTFDVPRADALFEASRDYLARVGGPDGTRAIQALRTLQTMRDVAAPSPGAEFHARLAAMFEQVYPEKCHCAGPDGLRDLFARTAHDGQLHGLRSTDSFMLVSALMFVLGHGCTSDPLYPWIAATLARSEPPDPDERAALLRTRAFTYLDRVLADLA